MSTRLPYPILVANVETYTTAAHRTFPLSASPTETPTEEGVQAAAATAKEAVTASAVAASAPVVPASLLDDIQEIKAAVQALASGAFGPRAPIPRSLPEQAVAPTDSSSSEAATSSHQPKPPDKPRGQESGTSPSPPTSSPTRRRISAPISFNESPMRQPRVSSITYIPNSGSTPGMEKQEGFPMTAENLAPTSNNAEAINLSLNDSSNGDGGNEIIETQRPTREGEQAEHHQNHEGHSPRDEAPGVVEATHGKGEEPTSVHVPAVIPPSSALQEETEGEYMRQRPPARSTSGSGEGETVDAAGGSHQEPPHLEDNPLVPVAREANLSGFSSGDGSRVNGSGVVVGPETSVADEVSLKHPERTIKTAESIQPAEGDEEPNGSSSRRSSTGSGRRISASPSSTDNRVGIASENIENGGGVAIDEEPEKCYVA